MTQREVAAELGRIIGELFHSEGSLERAVEELEHQVADWRAAITPIRQDTPDAPV